jgi:GTP cyclohydrolase II
MVVLFREASASCGVAGGTELSQLAGRRTPSRVVLGASGHTLSKKARRGDERTIVPFAEAVPGPAAERARVDVPIMVNGAWVTATLVAFHGLVDPAEHLALVFGQNLAGRPLVRIHSECLTGDVFASTRCDCGPQLRETIGRLVEAGGVLLYLRQEGRGIGLYAKLDAYRLQDEGLDTYEANRRLGFPEDMRDYRVAVQMLRALGIHSVRLLTNNPDKVSALRRWGIDVAEVIPTGVHVTERNHRYLQAKARYAGHGLPLLETRPPEEG